MGWVWRNPCDGAWSTNLEGFLPGSIEDRMLLVGRGPLSVGSAVRSHPSDAVLVLVLNHRLQDLGVM